MANNSFPTDFNDPAYDDAEASAAQVTGIPQSALKVIRTVGERSNADQVSSASAESPYQFTPTTRALILKKYNIDPLASPEAAALGAAYLWREGFQRTGSAEGAFQQYHGGTDPNNYGPVNRAYTKRTTAAFMKTAPDQSDVGGANDGSSQSGGPAQNVVLNSFSSAQPFTQVPSAKVSNPSEQADSRDAQIARDYPGLSAEDQAAVRAAVGRGDLKIDPSTLNGTKQTAGASAPSNGDATPSQAVDASTSQSGWSDDKIAALKAKGATFNAQGQLVLSAQGSNAFLSGAMDPGAAAELKADIASGRTILSGQQAPSQQPSQGDANAGGTVATGAVQNQAGTGPAFPDAAPPPSNAAAESAAATPDWTPQQVHALTLQGAKFNDKGQLVLSAAKAKAYRDGALPSNQMTDLSADLAAGKVTLPSENGAVREFGAGVGAGFGKAVLGLQNLAGEGIEAAGNLAGSSDGQGNAVQRAGRWLQKDAQQGTSRLTQQEQAEAGDSTAGKVGDFVGTVAPAVIAGGLGATGLGAQSVLAGAQAAGESGARGESAGQQATAGATGAGLTYAGGKALGFIGEQLAKSPTIAKGINAAKSFFGQGASDGGKAIAAGEGKDAGIAADIAKAAGQRPDELASALESAPKAQTPGYTPTAAELANDARVTGVQRTAQNAQPGVSAEADAANDEALNRYMAQRGTPSNKGTAADPQAATQAAETAAQKSDALAAQGQTEVQPIAPNVAQQLQTPQFEAPVKLAQRMARDEGSTVFDDLQKSRQAAAANTLEQVIGTPEQLDALKAARGAQAADDFLSTNVGVPADDPRLQSLLQRPAVKKALTQAQADAQNQGQSSIFTTAGQRGNANMGGAKGSPQQYVSGRGLLGIKTALDDQIGAAARTGETGQVRTLQGVKNQLLSFMDDAIPDYGKARANYAAASGPIDAMQSIQQRLYSAIDPVSKEVDPGKLVSAINSIKAEQMKPGIRAADKVEPDTLDALTDLARHLQNKNDLTGLTGEGQEFIRRALASSDKHAAAHQEFQKVIDAQSPAYKELHGSHAQQISEINSQVTSQTALAQAQDAIENSTSAAGLRSVDKMLPNMEAADRAKAIALRQDKAHELAMAELQTIRRNAAGGAPVENGTVNKLLSKYGGDMSADDLARFKDVAADVNRGTITSARMARTGGSDTAQNLSMLGKAGEKVKDLAASALANKVVFSALGFAGAGPAGGMAGYVLANEAVAPAIRKVVSKRVADVTSEGAARLLSNGPMLAAKLRSFESIQARQEFFRQLAQKAAVPLAQGASTKAQEYVGARNQ